MLASTRTIRRAGGGHRLLAIVVLLLAALALSCDGATEPVRAGPAARLLLVSGDTQGGVVAEPLAAPLVVRAEDDEGRAVAGQTVEFRVEAGGGSVAPATVTTDERGGAEARWALGTVAADTQRATAVLSTPTGVTVASVTFRAVGRPDVPSRLESEPLPATAFTGSVHDLAVTVRDAHGNPVAGATVVWAVAAGGGAVTPSSSDSDAEGVARATWTLGAAAGPNAATATTNGVTATFATTAEERSPLVTVGEPLARWYRISTRTALCFVGSVNPRGLTSAAYFEWGDSPTLAGAARVDAVTSEGRSPSLGGERPVAVEGEACPDLPPAGSTLYVRLTATNEAGTTASEIRQFTIGTPQSAPAGLASSFDEEYFGVRLVWRSVPGAYLYSVSRRLAADATYTVLSTDLYTQTDTTWIDRTIATETAQDYVYQVKACNGLGCGPGAELAVSTPRLEPPTDLTATIAPGVVTLSWTAPVLPCASCFYSVAVWRRAGATDWAPIASVPRTMGTQWADTGVVLGGKYAYRLVTVLVEPTPRTSTPSGYVSVIAQ